MQMTNLLFGKYHLRLTDKTMNTKLTPKEIITRAESITTLDVTTMPEAVELLSSLNRIKDDITAQKELVTRPLLDKLAEERAKWKPKEIRLESVITRIRTALTMYQTELVVKQRAEQEAIAKKLENNEIKPETAIKRMQKVEEVQNTVESNTGKITFKTVTKFKLVDHTVLSAEYLLLNEEKVREMLKNGQKLVGIEYLDEQVPVNYR